MENLLKNQGLLWWLIVSLILMTLMFESTVILYGKIRSQPLVGIEGLRRQGAMQFLQSPPSVHSYPYQQNAIRHEISTLRISC